MFSLLVTEGQVFNNICINWKNLSTRRAQVMSGSYYSPPCQRTIVGKWIDTYNIPNNVTMRPLDT